MLKRHPKKSILFAILLGLAVLLTPYMLTALSPDTDPYDALDLGFADNEQYGGAGLIGGTVRISTGNAMDGRTDISLPSPYRMGLTFSACYNSQDEGAGDFGYGWSHTYSVRLFASVSTTYGTLMEVVDDTGRGHFFSAGTGGRYDGEFHEKTHVMLEGSEYVWYRLDGSRYGFENVDGRLIWIEDPAGNLLNIAYDLSDRLDTVTDAASGRVLTFSYNANDRIETIEGPITTALPSGVYATYTYDVNGNQTDVTYGDGSGFTYTYDDPYGVNLLTEKQNKESHVLASWSYETNGLCTGYSAPDGTGFSIVYVSATQVDVTDAYGTARTYILADINGRSRVTELLGTAMAPYDPHLYVGWNYDTALNLTEIEDARGTLHEYLNFDSRGNPGTAILAYNQPEERTITLTWHPDMNALLTRTESSVLDNGDKVTTWDYDTDGNTIANEAPGKLVTRLVESGYTKDAAGTVVSYEYISAYTYNAKGQLTDVDGPRSGTGDTTTLGYDPATGDLLTVTKPLVGATALSNYDAAGQIGQITDVNSQVENLAYDARGRLTTITHVADSSTRTIAYNLAGQPVTVTDEDGVVKDYTYDPTHGYLTHITDMDGNYIEHTYDAQGNRIETGKYTAAAERRSRKRWNYQNPQIPGLLWKSIKYNDAFSETIYDANGNAVSVTDYNGNTETTTFDALNRPETVTEPGTLGVTTYTYNDHGLLASVTDAEGNTTAYTYDDMGRALSVDSPDSGLTTQIYDEAGNPVQKTDALGITVSYLYDDLNRPMARQYPNSAEDVTFTYDAGTDGIGRLTGITDPSGAISFGYDNRGRLISKDSTILTQIYTIERAFTAAGRLLQIGYPSGRLVNFTRDTNGRVTGATTQSATRMIELFKNLTYNPFGIPSAVENGAGGEGASQSSDCGCIEVLNPGKHMEQVYAYDDNGNVTGITWTNVPAYNQSYTYDELNRLTGATNPLGSFSYTYDNVGCRLTKTHDTATETYTYVTGTNMLDTVTGAVSTSYTHDAAGNITAMGSRTLVYNQAGRLQRVEESSTVLGEYEYNALGQRVTKTVNGTITVFHYDFNGNLIAESASDGTFTKEYIHALGNRFAMVDVTEDKVYYYMNDHLGTPIFMTDENNVIVWEGTYEPFGFADVSPSSEIENNFRFAGQYFDAETDLHYNYHRYYDPKTGRYLTPDPIGLTGGINLYAYANNNSVNLIDPFGLWWDTVTQHTRKYGPLALGAVELAGTVADAIDTYETTNDPCASNLEKAGTVGLFLFGMVAPGSGYNAGLGITQKVSKRVPIWSSKKSKTSVENAFSHFKKHGSEFPGIQNSKQYVEKAKDFLSNPPKGTLTKKRSNGDILRYDPKTNTFGVQRSDGAPRTMFKPEDGIDYWNLQ